MERGEQSDVRRHAGGWRRRNRFRSDATGPIYAALDLGTNNCRMMLAVPDGQGFGVVDSYSRIVRLGEGLITTGRLCDAAVDRTIQALQVCARRMQRRKVHRMRCIATEACRQADNRQAFLDRVTVETGLVIEPITPDEEATLTIAGCLPLFEPEIPHGLIFDIGGGSTELSWVAIDGARDLRILGVLSIPSGVVSLAEEYPADRMRPEDFEAIVRRIDASLAAFDAQHGIGQAVARGAVQMLGTSGTVTTLGGVHLDLPRYDRSRVDGLRIGFDDLRAASDRLCGTDTAGRAAHPCIGRERADLVVAGCAILEAVCRRWPVGRLCIADRGIREGLLLAMMADDHTAGTA